MLSKGEFSEIVNKEISKENLIIVEGKKDLNSLVYIGFDKKNIFVLNNGKSFLENMETVNEIIEKNKIAKSKTQEKQSFSGPRKFRKFSRVSILTDLDKKGKLLYSQIKREIIDKKRIDEYFRNLLLTQKISHVEGLSSYIGLD